MYCGCFAFRFLISETGTKEMTLLCALDDLLVRTLSAFPSVLARVEYLSSLKGPDGHYVHWGLTLVHGEVQAQRALAESHERLISEVLQTPLNRLMEDAEAGCAAQERRPSAYLKDLSTRSTSLLPEDMGGGSSRHFSSVLHALSALARAPRSATRPGA
jgi:hypothetical protein